MTKSDRVSTFLLFVFGLLHLYLVSKSAIDVPYRDEWQFMTPEFGSISWIFSAHNEHYIFTTKFLIFLLYKLFNWNISIHLFLNCALLFFIIYKIYFLLKEHLPSLVLSTSLALFFSPLGWENHTWSMQSCIYLQIIFMLLAIERLGKEKVTGLDSSVAAIYFALSSFSFASGIFSSLVLSFYFLIIKKSKALLPFIVSIFIFIFIAFNSSSIQNYNFVRISNFLLNLISFGFGVTDYSYFYGVVILALFLYGFTNIDFKTRSVALFFGILSVLLIISVGRFHHQDIEIWSKGSRFYSFSVILFPLLLSLLWQKKQFGRTLAVMVLGLSLYFNASNSDFKIYAWIGSQKKLGIERIKVNQDAKKLAAFELGQHDIAAGLKVAKQKKLSFCR